MAITSTTYVGNGATVLYTIPFPYLLEADLTITLDGTPTTAFTFANATTIKFDVAPGSGIDIKIQRNTGDSEILNTFSPTSAIPAESLNENFLQSFFIAQENSNKVDESDATAIAAVANLALDTANTAETTADNALSVANGIAATAAAAVVTADAADAIADAATVTANAANANALTALALGMSPRRNRFINGDFKVWQPGVSTALTSAGQLIADMWKGSLFGAARFTASRDADAPAGSPFEYSLKLDCTTADTSLAVNDYFASYTTVEGWQIADLVGQDFTIEFRVKSNKTGTFCVSLNNTGSDRSYVEEFTIDAANTWETKQFTVVGGIPSTGTWDFRLGLGLSFNINLVSGTQRQTGTTGAWVTGDFYTTANQDNWADSTSNEFWIAGCRMVRGTVLGDYDLRSFEDELRMCKRYWRKSYDYDVYPGASGEFGGAITNDFPAGSTNNYYQNVPFDVEMRATPSITIYAANDGSSGNVTKYPTPAAVTGFVDTNYTNTKQTLISLSTGNTAYNFWECHYVADATL